MVRSQSPRTSGNVSCSQSWVSAGCCLPPASFQALGHSSHIVTQQSSGKDSRWTLCKSLECSLPTPLLCGILLSDILLWSRWTQWSCCDPARFPPGTAACRLSTGRRKAGAAAGPPVGFRPTRHSPSLPAVQCQKAAFSYVFVWCFNCLIPLIMLLNLCHYIFLGWFFCSV